MPNSVKRKDQHKADQLAVQYMGFARALARRVQRTLPLHVDGEAIESDAMLGLIMAARAFNPARGAAFTTYAGKRILGSILDGLRERRGGRRAYRLPRVFSLSAPLNEHDDYEVGFEELLDDRSEPVGAALERREEVDRLLGRLAKEPARLIREHYLDELTQEQIGRRHKLSPSRVSQLLKAARIRLQEIALSN